MPITERAYIPTVRQKKPIILNVLRVFYGWNFLTQIKFWVVDSSVNLESNTNCTMEVKSEKKLWKSAKFAQKLKLLNVLKYCRKYYMDYIYYSQ